MGALRYCGLMNANFYVGCILPWFSGPTHRVRSWTYALLHYEASTDGPPPLFPGTCDFKQQLLSLPRERAQRGKVPFSERQIGLGVCPFDGDHKQWPVWGLQNHYIYIRPNLRVLDWGSLWWLHVSINIWHQILETGSYPLGLNWNFRWCVAVTDKNLSE